MHNRSVSAATDINFPPNDLTLNLMPAFLSLKKSKERTGCQLVLRLPRICKSSCGDSRRCAYKPHGEKVVRIIQVHVASRSSRWDLLAHEHPAFHPRLIYYNVPVINLISLFEANFTNYRNMQENCPNH